MLRDDSRPVTGYHDVQTQVPCGVGIDLTSDECQEAITTKGDLVSVCTSQVSKYGNPHATLPLIHE